MKFTVVWKPAAERELVQLWTDAIDRAAVIAAANTIDQLLASNPEEQGESRDGVSRVLFVLPLGTLYDVHARDRRVTVLRVWRVA